MRFKIFVYGTLKKGFRLHPYLSRASYLGEAELEGFKMYDLGRYPGIVSGKGKVYGEVYEVDLKTLLLLDEIEEEGEEYERRLLEVKLKDGRRVRAFVYIYRGDISGKKEIKSGRWEKR